jgi:hypothetical protein
MITFNTFLNSHVKKSRFLSLKSKNSEQLLVKLEYEKKIADLMNLLQKKQSQIDELIVEKR